MHHFVFGAIMVKELLIIKPDLYKSNLYVVYMDFKSVS